ncbi:MAG: Gfo/Idh/MocA family oxidoreductase, partial [Clostridia bacterium]|nr:Gfo/Idh/MocA family oxidoreductase [Clostridia bacterium]
MLNLGILGVWHVHTDDYAQQTLKSGLAALKTVWDADEQAGRACADKYGLTFIKDLDAFLTDPAIDAVICCSPTTFHQTALVKAARAGKHIFTEKLLADTSAQAEVIEQAVQQASIRCAVSMPLLSSAWYQYVKQMVNNGRLGRVTGARMRRSHSGVSDKWLPARWYDVSLSGGGAMMDLGAHPVYVLADLFGKPARVTGL